MLWGLNEWLRKSPRIKSYLPDKTYLKLTLDPNTYKQEYSKIEKHLRAESHRGKSPQEVQIYWSSGASNNHLILPLPEISILFIKSSQLHTLAPREFKNIRHSQSHLPHQDQEFQWNSLGEPWWQWVFDPEKIVRSRLQVSEWIQITLAKKKRN